MAYNWGTTVFYSIQCFAICQKEWKNDVIDDYDNLSTKLFHGRLKLGWKSNLFVTSLRE